MYLYLSIYIFTDKEVHCTFRCVVVFSGWTCLVANSVKRWKAALTSSVIEKTLTRYSGLLWRCFRYLKKQTNKQKKNNTKDSKKKTNPKTKPIKWTKEKSIYKNDKHRFTFFISLSTAFLSSYITIVHIIYSYTRYWTFAHDAMYVKKIAILRITVKAAAAAAARGTVYYSSLLTLTYDTVTVSLVTSGGSW